MLKIFATNTMKEASNCIMEQLKKVDQSNLDVKHIVIVPDRASLEAERQLLSATLGSFNIQVLTFRRLASKILPKSKYLSKQAGIVALSTVIADKKDQLVCYTKGANSSGFVNNMYDTISTLKYCKVSPEQLLNGSFPEAIKAKLQDIGMLYQGYQDFLADNYIDSADRMDELADAVLCNKDVENTHYYFFDFDNFSMQELAVLENLLKKGRSVTVACPYTNEKSKQYLFLNDIYNSVLAVANKLNVEKQVVFKSHYDNKYLEHIGENIYVNKKATKINTDNFLNVFEGATRVQEVYALACRISKHIRSGGRYNDVFVITSDIKKYQNAIATVFEEFDIPYFCDRQYNLSDHIYSQYIVDYLNMFKNNFDIKSVLVFVKNPYFSLCDTDVYQFENFCLKYNVSYNFAEFKLGKEDVLFEGSERVRQKLWNLVGEVKFSQTDIASNYVDNLYKLAQTSELATLNEEFGAKQKAQGLDFEARVTDQIEKKLAQVLDQIAEILQERPIKLDEFLNVLTSVIASVNISVLPVTTDCVVLANMAKARKHDIKFLALLGANAGQMPIIKGDSKLLTDINIKQMSQYGVLIEPLMYTENRRERFSLYQLLLEPTQQLYVSYTITDGNDNILPSEFVTQLQDVFVNDGNEFSLATTDEDVYTKKQAISKLVLNRRKLEDNQLVKMPYYSCLYKHLKTEISEFYFSKDAQNLSISCGGDLFLQNLETSVSKITEFYNCPYKYYFHYGLNALPRKIANLESNDLGTILHDVLAYYVKNMDEKETESQTKVKAEKYFAIVMQKDFYSAILSDVSMKNTLYQLKKECVRMCQEVKKQLVNSDFKCFGAEMGFGGNYSTDGVQVNFDGGKFNLKGVVDRFDICGNKFIVIDYKSGKNASVYRENQLYIGHKLQLLVYLKAILNAYNDFVPAGFYYLNMHNNFTSPKDDNKLYSYNGRTLGDIETAQQIDRRLVDGYSPTLKLKLTKDGNLSRQGTQLLTSQQIDAEIDYAIELIAKAGQLLTQGYIAINPHADVCDYCEYKSICDYGDIYTHQSRKTPSVSATDIEKIILENKWKNTPQDKKKL